MMGRIDGSLFLRPGKSLQYFLELIPRRLRDVVNDLATYGRRPIGHAVGAVIFWT